MATKREIIDETKLFLQKARSEADAARSAEANRNAEMAELIRANKGTKGYSADPEVVAKAIELYLSARPGNRPFVGSLFLTHWNAATRAAMSARIAEGRFTSLTTSIDGASAVLDLADPTARADDALAESREEAQVAERVEALFTKLHKSNPQMALLLSVIMGRMSLPQIRVVNGQAHPGDVRRFFRLTKDQTTTFLAQGRRYLLLLTE